MEAMLGLFGIPLSALGIYSLYGVVSGLIKKRDVSPSINRCATVGLMLVILVVLVLPVTGSFGATQFSRIATNISNDYSLSSSTVLSDDEAAFLKDVKSTVGDALVINLPDDGSAFAYSVADINTYYRNTRTYGGSSESPESKIIRTSLCDVGSSSEVKQALNDLNAQYVLLLDEGTTDEMPCLFTWDFYSDLWEGMTNISDETPGFEVVLSERDMRLYKVVA